MQNLPATRSEQNKLTQRMTACFACGNRPLSLKRCQGCRAVFYCNRNCQKDNWPVHKATCRKHMQQAAKSISSTSTTTTTTSKAGEHPHPQQEKDKESFEDWLRRRGPDVKITEENLKDYVPNVEYKEPAATVPARTAEKIPEYPELDSYNIADPGPQELENNQHWDDTMLQAHRDGLGRCYTKICWRQTTRAVMVCMLLPPETRSKHVQVDLTPTSLRVWHQTAGTICNHQFASKVYVGGTSDSRGSTWEIVHRRCLVLMLEKWDCEHTDACLDASRTFWFRIWQGTREYELATSAKSVPTCYYATRDLQLQ
eukprot:TRINITY_DN7399_c0_g1_i3.p1 TRINITY_DN7399_c0_g1~~TRINITY_DN7399_c0_g1_i3.p1  ORF type:complete len:313 (+),score=41.57 TRINITY_DN7399_c0_g1_i3:234-1172(+)